MGSASELQNHLRLAKDLGFRGDDDYRMSLEALTSIRKMLTAFLQALRRGGRPQSVIGIAEEWPKTQSQKPIAKG